MIVSPKSVIEFPLPSTTTAVLFTVNAGDLVIGISVGSFSVFPSSSSPLSLISEISLVVLFGLLPVTVTVFLIPPRSTALCSIT